MNTVCQWAGTVQERMGVDDTSLMYSISAPLTLAVDCALLRYGDLADEALSWDLGGGRTRTSSSTASTAPYTCAGSSRTSTSTNCSRPRRRRRCDGPPRGR